MLQLTAPEGTTRFPDHAEPHVLHQLPAGLKLTKDADGTPRFQLVRFRGNESGSVRGAFVHAELVFDRGAGTADGDWIVRPVIFDRARFRLLHWVSTLADATPVGEWQTATPRGSIAIGETVSLDSKGVQILDKVLTSGTGGFDVELEASFEGIVPGFPAVVTADLAALHQRLKSGLPGGTPAPIEAVRAAFLGLPDDPAVLKLEIFDGVSTRDKVLAELAERAVADLFDRVGDDWAAPLYRLKPSATGARYWDLQLPRFTSRIWRTGWSVSGLFASLTPEQRAKHFPELSSVDPFAEVTVTVINQLPADSKFLTGSRVDVSYTGPSGTRERKSLSFNGDRTIERFSAFYPVFTDEFGLTGEFVGSLAPAPDAQPPWPVAIGPVPLTPVDEVIRVTPADVGLAVIRAEADPGFFTRAYTADLTVTSGGKRVAAARLTESRASAAIVIPQGEFEVVAEAAETSEPSSVRVEIGRYAGVDTVRVPAAAVQVIMPDEVTVVLTTAELAYAAVTLQDPAGRTRTMRLDPDTPVTWPCWRTSVFGRIRYRYQLSYVAVGPDGHTQPMKTTSWRDATTSRLSLGKPE
ncbi:hypothetical protein AB5J62_23390 [Amycolatopsis sp. cg5]|uniref:hypothetical protein n=1 Tax=Amycolatopsis sp. cg5 TaxID=3238802 RepID=UPI0035269360